MRKLFFLFPLIFLACSKNTPTKENLTALKWHTEIYKNIQVKNLDAADNDFISLEAEHPTSIYIKTDLLALFLAHLKSEEYDLSEFYLNQYEKRFASLKDIEWIEYQKIKLHFLKYQNPYTDQKAILDLIKECNNYISSYPNSKYKFEVATILAKADLTKRYLNDKIYKLYKKLDKPKAAKLYKTKIPKNSKPPVVPWYKKLFYW